MRSILFLLLFVIFFSNPLAAQVPVGRELAPETWVATDALGRSLPTEQPTRPGRKVGVFYFLWHGEHGKDGPFDNTLTHADPSGHPYGKAGAFHWWGEPAVGYFLADDPWVHRKNLQMLADAGVDVIFLDVTNAFTYPKNVRILCDAAEDMRRQGNPTPQIAFLTHSATAKTVATIYRDFYAKGLYKDLWFQWDGKPLILGDRRSKMDDGSPMDPKMVDFFTWRDSWAWDPGQDKWQWLDKYPQRPGWHTDPATPEEVPVSIAGHPVDSLGRSYHSDESWGQGAEPPVDTQSRTNTSGEGRQFAQQWQRALKIDPQFIFVTGWNEWVAQRFLTDGPRTFAGRPEVKGETFFVDNFNEEFSRDAMPMKGGYGDNYYLQLVDGIRRFKGTKPAQVAQKFQTISLAGGFRQWLTVKPLYLDDVGDTTHRNHNGWGKLHYADTSGRNDITSSRVACDARNIYFTVHTQAPLTPSTGPHWMQLLIDSDQNPRTGWNGYDFVVSSRVISPGMTTLKRLSDGKSWPVPMRVAGNDLMFALPRTLLALRNLSVTTFDFHWADNVLVGGDPKRIADWWYQGDSAPNGRFNYRYRNVRGHNMVVSQ